MCCSIASSAASQVTRRDDVEQFLVGFRMASQAVRPERGHRGAVEVGHPAAELPRHLHQQRVVGEPPEVLVELLVEFVHQRQVVLLGGADHRVHDRLELGTGGRGEPAPEPLDGELLEHHPQARHLFEHPRRQAGHPRPAPGRAHHQALLLQPGQRLAQRDVADAEQVREAALDEAVAGSVDPALDVGPEPVRDGVGEAVVGQRLGHAGPPG